MPKVSVIVPVYNVAKWIERSVRSLFSQSLDDVEFIFVNDCTPDNSMDIVDAVLSAFASRRHQTKIINHPFNRGVAQARQTGIDNATGEYTIHFDPDDWVGAKWLESLYIEAKCSGADMVTCDYIAEYGSESVFMPQRPSELSVSALKHGLATTIWGGLWNKLIKTDVFAGKIRFEADINYQEDSLFCYKCLCNCHSISHVSVCQDFDGSCTADTSSDCLYHYNKANQSSISSKPKSVKHRFFVKCQIDAIEEDIVLRNSNKYHICKGYELIELWTSKSITNAEFVELSSPFMGTVCKRGDMGVKWKALILMMNNPIGKLFRSLYLNR